MGTTRYDACALTRRHPVLCPRYRGLVGGRQAPRSQPGRLVNTRLEGESRTLIIISNKSPYY